MKTPSSSPGGSRPKSRFATTRWSLVLAAAERDSPRAERALESLCQSYWYPLYAYVRHQGRQPAEAQDLTQEFFTCLLDKRFLDQVDRDRGRFRTFLLTVFKRFLANQQQRERAQKRGGGAKLLSLDFREGERRLQLEPAHDWTPERVFERRWALTLLDEVLDRLAGEYAARGKQRLFERLQDTLTGGKPLHSYRQMAADLELTEGAVKVAVHRLRRRYRELLRDEITQTVAEETEVEDELHVLLQALRGDGPDHAV